MRLSDVVQIVSVIAVATALIFNYRQARETGRQANETARQVQVSTSILKHDAGRQLTDYETEMLISYLTPHPTLLEWFLRTRGLSVGTHDENLRQLFIFIRTDVHAFAFRGHRSGQLDDQAWTAWLNVITLDFATPEFRALWPVVCDQYPSEFSHFVEAVLDRRDTDERNAAVDVPEPRSGLS